MNENNSSRSYDDIIDLPHHVSSRHLPMPRRDRAAQFAPFAALTGHGAAISETARITDEPIELSEDAKAILDMKQQMILEALPLRPQVTITRFCPDGQKQGGVYRALTGTVKSIDPLERVMIMESGERIPLHFIIELESELFSGTF